METVPCDSAAFDTIWGSSPQDVWAAGNCGLLAHYTGSEWHTSYLHENDNLDGLFGLAADDIYLVSNRIHYSSEESVDEVIGWITGFDGAFFYSAHVYHFDGTEWQVVFDLLPLGLRLSDVWASGPNDVYAVGDYYEDGSGIYHFDGDVWQAVPRSLVESPMPAGMLPYSHLVAVSGSSPESAHLIGGIVDEEDGWLSVLLTLDNDRWQYLTYVDEVVDLWASSPDNVIAVGHGEFDDVNIMRFNGDVWAPVQSPTTAELRAVHGTVDGEFIAVGNEGTVVISDDGEWTLVTEGELGHLRGVWGNHSDMYAAGTRERSVAYNAKETPTIYHFDGYRWRIALEMKVTTD